MRLAQMDTIQIRKSGNARSATTLALNASSLLVRPALNAISMVDISL